MSISIELDDIIDQIDDEDLLEEIKRRKLPKAKLDTMRGPIHDLSSDLEDAYRELLNGRSNVALSILDRLLHPKWPSVDRCKAAFASSSSPVSPSTPCG